jgi:hypothetical protein
MNNNFLKTIIIFFIFQISILFIPIFPETPINFTTISSLTKYLLILNNSEIYYFLKYLDNIANKTFLFFNTCYLLPLILSIYFHLKKEKTILFIGSILSYIFSVMLFILEDIYSKRYNN